MTSEELRRVGMLRAETAVVLRSISYVIEMQRNQLERLDSLVRGQMPDQLWEPPQNWMVSAVTVQDWRARP